MTAAPCRLIRPPRVTRLTSGSNMYARARASITGTVTRRVTYPRYTTPATAAIIIRSRTGWICHRCRLSHPRAGPGATLSLLTGGVGSMRTPYHTPCRVVLVAPRPTPAAASDRPRP